jgi:hypothetical protein
MPQIEKVIKSIAIPESIMEAIKTELEKDLEFEQKEKVIILSKLKQEHAQIKIKIQNWN